MKVINIIFPAENNQAILTFDKIDVNSLIIAQNSQLTGAECFLIDAEIKELIKLETDLQKSKYSNNNEDSKLSG